MHKKLYNLANFMYQLSTQQNENKFFQSKQACMQHK